MAQIWTESVRWCGSSITILGRRYFAANGNINSSNGRDGGACVSGDVTAYPKDPAPSGPHVIGFLRFRVPGASCLLAQFGTDANWEFNFYITSTGDLQLRRGTNILGQTGAGYFNLGQLYGLAFKVKIDPAAGTSEVYADGTAIANLTATGLNTANASGTSWNSFKIGTAAASLYWCDLYLADETNPTGNDICDIIDDVRVDYLAANGAGYATNWTPSAGSNYQNVDDASPNDDTDYNETTAAAIDSFTHVASAANIQPIGVTSLAVCRKSDSGVASTSVGCRTGTTNDMSPGQALPITYLAVCSQHGVNPTGNAVWTESAVNAAEVVVERPA